MTPRLKTRSDFDRVFSRGRYAGSGPLTLRFYPRGEEAPSRFGWVVGKGVGGAVDRNRLRRRLRAIISALEVAPGFDCVFIARNPVDEPLRQRVEGLLEESGLIGRKVSVDG